MPDDVLALADRLWRGELGPGEYHPVSHLGGLRARLWPPPCTASSGAGTAAG